MKVPFVSLMPLHEKLKVELDGVYNQVMANSNYISGDFVKKFENDYASYCGSKYAVGCGNGLDAITIGLRALGIAEGDEVIVPSFTFIATVLAVVYAGATPVFVDVDDNANIDIDKIEKAITPKTKAIIPVHLYGRAVDMPSLMDFACRNGLKVVEDCAQAHGAEIGGKKVGTFGDVGAFSFYPGKNLGALGDAGAMITDSDEIITTLRAIGNYGSTFKYQHDYAGINSRLDEMQAGFLDVKLRCLCEVNAARRVIVKKYLAGIRNPRIILPNYPEDEKTCVWHLFVVRAQERDRLHDYLVENGIGSISHYPIPMNKQKALKDVKTNAADFVNAEKLSSSVLSLPLYYGMTDVEINYIIDTINNFT